MTAHDWMSWAACRNEDPTLWDGMASASKYAGHKYLPLALTICREQCPVREECLEDALADDTDDCSTVIRGGLLPRERKVLAKGRAGVNGYEPTVVSVTATDYDFTGRGAA